MTAINKSRANKAVHGLSVGTIIWMFATFVPKDDFKDAMAQEHRDRMDAELQCDARFEKLALSGQVQVYTNSEFIINGKPYAPPPFRFKPPYTVTVEPL